MPLPVTLAILTGLSLLRDVLTSPAHPFLERLRPKLRWSNWLLTFAQSPSPTSSSGCNLAFGSLLRRVVVILVRKDLDLPYSNLGSTVCSACLLLPD